MKNILFLLLGLSVSITAKATLSCYKSYDGASGLTCMNCYNSMAKASCCYAANMPIKCFSMPTAVIAMTDPAVTEASNGTFAKAAYQYDMLMKSISTTTLSTSTTIVK